MNLILIKTFAVICFIKRVEFETGLCVCVAVNIQYIQMREREQGFNSKLGQLIKEMDDLKVQIKQ